ncbi:MAG: MFS transporter [Thermoprotei archaeon]|nr:MFS transporter [Thermoprotei archaeon]
MRFKELPAEARRYILYHTLISPILITWYMLPFYLLMTGYNVLEVGVIFTIAQVVSIPVTLILGKVFTHVDLRKGLMAIDLMGSISLVCYYLAYGPLAPLMVVMGELIDNIAGTLYFLYPAYERIVYPEDRMKEALAWHLRLPELSTIIVYPIIGYILGYLYADVKCFRNTFLLFAIYELMFIPYIFFCFKPIVLSSKEDKKERSMNLRDLWNRYGLYIVADLLFILAWSLTPGLALVYFVLKRLKGNMFHVALIEAAISTATLTSTYITDLIKPDRAFQALQIGTFVTIIGLSLMATTNNFIMILIAAYITRIGDALVFVFKRTWLYSIMTREEASVMSATLSSIRKVISIVSPFIVGLLSYVDPRMPYIACIILLATTIPIYYVASKCTNVRS